MESTPHPSHIDRYEILEKLGEGGQGIVYRVRNVPLGRIEALKILKQDPRTEPEEVERFLREARVLGALRHPNIVAVHEVGTHEGRPFYTMEFVDGESVAAIVKRQGRLTPHAAMKIGRDCARALHAAHEHGVIHRDVKPHNMLVCTDSAPTETSDTRAIDDSITLRTGVARRYRVLLTDFGLARVTGERSITVESGLIMGTVAYMSPEAARGDRRAVDGRSDVYSLGASLYHALTGEVPHGGKEFYDILARIQSEEPRPPRAHVPQLSPEIETIVLKCLEKVPARRYASAKDVADDIDRCLRGEVIHARPVSAAYRLYRYARRHAAVVLSLAAGLALAIASVVVFAVLPRMREVAEDRRALREASDGKLEEEKRVRDLMAAGQYDDAIKAGERLQGRMPAVPKLHRPERADEFPQLRQTYRVDLARAYLERARKGGARARADLANAYRSAVATGDDGVGREALLLLARDHEARGSHAVALATYRLCEARFAATPEVHARLAAALERAGFLEEARLRWEAVEGDGAFGPAAREALALLRALLPRRRLALAAGAVAVADLDGDRRAEVVHVSPEAVLSVFAWTESGLEPRERISLQRLIPSTAGRWLVEALDADGDGRREIFVAHGRPEQRSGILLCFASRGGRLGLAGEARTESYCADLETADLDGDGAPELIAAIGYFERGLRFYRYRDGAFAELGRLPVGCDPSLLMPRPEGVLLHLGPWLVDRGFRLVLVARGDDGRFVARSESPDRVMASSVLAVGEQDAIVSAVRIAEHAQVAPDLLETGLYRVSLAGGRLSAATRIDAPWAAGAAVELASLAVGGREHVVASTGASLHVLAPDGVERHAYGTTTGSPRALHSADLDGDGDAEVLLHSGDVLEVWGAAGAGDEPAPLPKPQADAGRRSAGEDLLEAQLYAEAEDVFVRDTKENPSDARAWFGLGNARLFLERPEEAAAAFAEAAKDRGLAAYARMRRSYAFQKARRWQDLAAELRLLDGTPGLDPYVREETRRRKSWALEAAAMAPRESIREWKHLPVYCENPLQVRVTEDGLKIWAGADRQYVTGVALAYDGGPLRVRFVVSCEEPAWETACAAGLGSVEALLTMPYDAPDRSGPAFFMAYAAHGASDQPTLRVDWAGAARDDRVVRAGAVLGPPRGRSRTLEHTLEYVPGLDRVYVSVKEEGGGEVVPPAEREISWRFDRGFYVLGRWMSRVRGPVTGGPFVTYVIRSIDVEGSTATHVRRPDSRTAREHLLLGNGDLSLGFHASAARAYSEAIRLAEADVETLWRAQLFASVLCLRMGDRARAMRCLGEARKLDSAGVDGMLRRAPALTEDEIDALTVR